jgi:lysozyme family protein
MSTISLTQTLRIEYENLFNTCIIRREKIAAVQSIVNKINANNTRYVGVSQRTGIPWGFIGVIHNMESGLNFSKHLHNGDPLTAKTVNYPPGRPEIGNPPFTWEDSAYDSLVNVKKLNSQTDWSLAGTLYQLERYNGFGYRNMEPAINSPYLWSFSSHYTSGKYVRDHVFDPNAVSQQCGAAVILRRMAEMAMIEFPDQPAPPPDTRPLVVGYSMQKPKDPLTLRRAEEL